MKGSMNRFSNKAFNSFMTEVPTISTDLQNKSMDWFLYDRDLRHERVKPFLKCSLQIFKYLDFYEYLNI